jgi:glucose/mannose-6-phosphate isomerase
VELLNTLAALRYQQESIGCESPVAANPAKRLAGQLVDRWPVVVGAGVLAPVARRWKGQLSELAKSWAQFEILPEADHNTVAGVVYPEEQLPRTMVLFLESPADHPRNHLRAEVTRKVLMLQGLGTDTFSAQGNSALANQWTALHFGDYLAYYLAMVYGVNPTPVEAIESLKAELGRAG